MYYRYFGSGFINITEGDWFQEDGHGQIHHQDNEHRHKV